MEPDIKVDRCSQLNMYMKLYEYQRLRSFIDRCPNHSDSIFLNFFSSITADFNISSTRVSDTGPMVLWFYITLIIIMENNVGLKQKACQFRTKNPALHAVHQELQSCGFSNIHTML